MLRSVSCFVLLVLFFGSSAMGQNTLPVKPKRLTISDSSPLSTLSSSSNSITPAAFLQQSGQGKDKQAIPAKPDNIPSILTGKKSTTERKIRSISGGSTKQSDEIDPLNIPSSPIQPKKLDNAPLNSGFQPRPGNFQPPKSTKQMSKQGIPSASPRMTSPRSSSSTGFPTTQGTPKTGRPSFSPPQKSGPQKSTTLNGASGKSAPTIEPNRTIPSNSSTPRIPSAPIRIDTPASNNGLSNPTTQTQNSIRNNGIRTGRSEPTRVAERSTYSPRGNNPASRPVGSSPINVNEGIDRTRQSDLFSNQQLSPQIKVLASGPRTVAVNKTGQFQVKISNVGQVDATDVMVGIEIPGWVEVVSRPTSTGGEAEVKDLGNGKGVMWNLSFLPAGRDAVINLKLEPKENRPFGLKTEWTTAPVSSEAKIMVTQAKLATRIAGPSEVKYGEKAVYTITIENTGNGNAEKVNVALSENLGGDSATVGLIEAGASKQFEVELTAGQAGPMKLAAMVKGEAGVNSSIAKEIVVRRAKLAVTATGPKFKYAGSALTYNISVENKGDAPAKNISAAALLPLNAEYISGLNQIGENDGRKIGWKISEIPAGSRRDFIVTCLINQAGEAKMEVGVRAEDGLTAGGVVSTKIEALADLKLEVVDPRGPQAVGRQITYELHIKNRGTKAARNVQISGEFSDFIDPVAGAGAKATVEKGGVIQFAPIPEIKVGQSVVIKVIAKASQAGTHTFRAIVECKEQDIRKISEGTTKFFGEATTREGDSANSNNQTGNQ